MIVFQLERNNDAFFIVLYEDDIINAVSVPGVSFIFSCTESLLPSSLNVFVYIGTVPSSTCCFVP